MIAAHFKEESNEKSDRVESYMAERPHSPQGEALVDRCGTDSRGERISLRSVLSRV
jgi:hypothetical protein